MIKFFRKIRHRLLRENRFSKYLIYAIGEIILVVIGILIALQVNNWNEKRKSNNTLTVYLERLHSDLTNEIAYLKREDSTATLRHENITKMIDTFFVNQNKYGLTYVIDNIRPGFSELVINKRTYDEMIATGALYRITNKKLLEEIQEYYLWSEINQLYVKANNDDVAATWQKQFFEYIGLIYHYKQKNQSYDHIDLSEFYKEGSTINMQFKAYLLQLEGTFKSKKEILKEEVYYAQQLANMLSEELKSTKD